MSNEEQFEEAAHREAQNRHGYGMSPSEVSDRVEFRAGASWARTYLAEREPTEDVVQAAVAAILALTDETEETARMDDIDVAWDHARAALTAVHATR